MTRFLSVQSCLRRVESYTSVLSQSPWVLTSGGGDCRHQYSSNSSFSNSSFSNATATGKNLKTSSSRMTSVPGVKVDVPHGNKVDRALRMLRRKLIDEGIRETWMSQRVFVKPSHERKRVLEEAVRRNASRGFKEKMRWILRRKARGY